MKERAVAEEIKLDFNGANTSKTAVLRALWNNFYPIVRTQGGELFGTVTKAALKPVVGDELAQQAAKVSNNTFQIGVTVSANVRDFTKVATDNQKRIKKLVGDVAPFLEDEFGKATRGKLMRSKNEVLQVERSRILGLTKSGFFTAGAGLVDKIPEVFKYVDSKRAEIETGHPTEDLSRSFGEVGAKIDQVGTQFAKASIFDKENRTLIETAVRTGAPVVQGYIEAEGKQKLAQTTAFDLIRDLADQFQSDPGNVNAVYNRDLGEHQRLSEYIVEIFKRHQQDIEGTPINDRFRFMPELEEASQAIAKEINDNLMDPMALVSLVGNRKVLDQHMKIASPSKLESELQRVRRVVEKAEKVDAKEFIAETAFATKEDFKEILDGLPEGEKVFFASLFPPQVLKELGGLKDAEIDAIKEKGAAEFSEKVLQAIDEIGKLDEKELQRYGLTKQEGELVRGLSDALEELGEREVIDALQGPEKQAVTEALRNARGYWQQRVKSGAVRSRVAADEVADVIESRREKDAEHAEKTGKDAAGFTEREEKRGSDSAKEISR